MKTKTKKRGVELQATIDLLKQKNEDQIDKAPFDLSIYKPNRARTCGNNQANLKRKEE